MGQCVHRPGLRYVPEVRFPIWIVLGWSLLPSSTRPERFWFRPRSTNSIFVDERPLASAMHLHGVKSVLEAEGIDVAIRSCEAGVDGGRDGLDLVPPKNVQHLAFGLALALEHDERVAVAVRDSLLIDGAAEVLDDHPPVWRFVPILA